MSNTADAPLETFRSVHEKIGVERCVCGCRFAFLRYNPARLFKFS